MDKRILYLTEKKAEESLEREHDCIKQRKQHEITEYKWTSDYPKLSGDGSQGLAG